MARNTKVAAEKKEKKQYTLMHPKTGPFDLKAEIDRQSDEIKAAIAAKQIVAVQASVKRDFADVPYEKLYLKLIPTDLQGAMILANGKETSWKWDEKDGGDAGGYFDGASLLKDYAYGQDLAVKARETQQLATLVEGPDKAKMAAAKNLSNAFRISIEAALAKIEAMGQDLSGETEAE